MTKLNQISVAATFLALFGTTTPDSIAQAVPNPDELVTIQFPNVPLPLILLEYERLTGKKIIRDPAVQGATLSIETTGEVTVAEATRFMEKSLLLNGYALIPSDEKTLKIVAYTGGGSPRSEGVPIYTEVAELPDTDQIVTFVMPFAHLGAEDAAKILEDVYPPHPYGKLTPYPNGSTVLISESTAVVRRYAELREVIDVPPSQVDTETFPLQRADAEQVVEALNELLNLSKSDSSSSTGPTSGPRAPIGGPRPGVQPTPAAAAAAGPGLETQTVEPRIQAVIRTNSILAIARPVDLLQIGTLIEHLDAPSEIQRFLTRQLNYISVSNFLPIASDALLRRIEDPGQAGIGGDQAISGGQTASTQTGLQDSGTSGQGGGGLGSQSSLSTGSVGASFNPEIGPQSLVVGKTLLIADNVHNRLMASGPPEHLEIVSELLDSMDQRPRQIQISAVIAQMTLGDDLQFGYDFARTVQRTGNGQSVAGLLKNRADPLLDVGTLTDIASLAGQAQGLTLYGQVDEYLSTYVSALESKSRFKVLARPSVYTLNNQRAVISTGQRIAVPGTSLSTVDPGNLNQAIASSIDYVEVLLQIEVLPLINSSGEVTLQIVQRNDDVIGSQNISGNDIPTIGTQQLATTVIVPDGGAVLLGGLISEDNRRTVNGLPIFVSLPLVGPLFGDTDRQENRRELLIFIQPKIVSDEVDAFNATADLRSRTDLAGEVDEFLKAGPKAEVKRKHFQWVRKLLSN